MPNKNEIDALIYKNANTYRLHADNLRWTLLGGYAAFIAGVFSIINIKETGLESLDIKISILLFVISFGYLFILAIQNWFYNLFAQWVDDCEHRLIEEKRLRSLQQFAKIRGPEITPYHPAFYVAELIVGSIAFLFLYLFLANLEVPTISEFINNLDKPLIFLLIGICFLIYFGVLHYIFKHWDRMVHKPIIVKLSNLYKPVIDLNEKS